MKKSAIILVVPVLFLFLTGCGQEFDMTVYNATGYDGSNGWVAIDAHTEGQDYWLLPTGSAQSDAFCDATNSYTYKAKENQTLTLGGNGAKYTFDANGVLTSTPFQLPNGTMTVYGELLSNPHWYAAMNTGSVIFYKK